MGSEHHEKLIEKKHTRSYKTRRIMLIAFYVIAAIWIIYILIEDERLAASLGVFSAAIIFALQNFVASISARLYIRGAGTYELGDIIKTGNPFMYAIGVVEEIGLFFTRIREMNETDLTFTGKTVSFPNYLIFNSGIFNYTKHNLMFWHEINISLTCRQRDIDTLLNNFKTIIEETYQQILKDKIYRTPGTSKNKKYAPTYQFNITPSGLEIKVRIMIHFYNVFNAHNELIIALIKGHNDKKIEIATEKDYMRTKTAENTTL